MEESLRLIKTHIEDINQLPVGMHGEEEDQDGIGA